MTKATDVRFIPSTFGGGWMEPLTTKGRDECAAFFETQPDYFAAIEGEGWMLEPYEVGSSIEMLRDRGLVVTL